MNRRRRILALAAALLIGLAILPGFLGDPEPAVLDEQSRSHASGRFVTVDSGTIHYVRSGPPEAEIVVLVHGFGSYSFVWDPLVPFLIDAGFQVLRYDLFGRGYSDRPAGPYDADLFDRQLGELLAALEVRKPVNLVGLSMGGAVAAVYTDRHPSDVRRLALLAPAGVPMGAPWLARLARLPSLGDWAMRLRSDAALTEQVTAQLYLPASAARFAGPFQNQLPFAGYRRALLSTIRQYPLFALGETYRRIGRNSTPALAVWGSDDSVLPVANLDYLRASIPSLQAHMLERAGHIVVFEEPERVAPLLIEFFRR